MRKITKVLSIVLAFALMLSAVTMVASASVFPDVTAGSDYEQAIDLLASLNILGGYEDGTFKPDNNITRAEFSKIVYVIFNGLSDPNGKMFASETNFDDVSIDSWYAGHVNWAYLNNIVGGYGDGTFLPNNNVAVKEAVKMIVTCITDKELSYPMGYIQEARALGLLDDLIITDTDAPATRGQIAQMAANLLVTNSRLCLKSTGRMDINGNEIYEKNPAITFVFGLNEVAGEDSEYIAMLAATYDNMFVGQNYLGGLEEGQVAFWLYNKTDDGKVGTLVSTTPYVYEYDTDISDLIGHYLTLYLTDNDELAAVVTRSTAISSTLNKMKANSGYVTANVDGTTIALDAYEDVETTLATGGMERHYYFERMFIQSSEGEWSETSTDKTKLRLSAIVSTSTRAQDNPITVIDADSNGEYDTYIQYYAANHKVEQYSYDAKTMTISYTPTDNIQQDGPIGGKIPYSADYVIGFDKFKDIDFNDPMRPVYGNFYVTIKGDGQAYLTANVSEAVEGKLESIASNGKSAKIDGKSYTSHYLTSTNDTYGFFHYNREMLGQNVRVYLDDCGYAQTMVLVDSSEDYGLNIVKVTAVTENADRFGNGLVAGMTVVDMDGNEKTYQLATETNLDESEYTFYTTVPEKWLKSTDKETFWAYDEANQQYAIVDNYIQLEVDETTGVVKNIMTIEDLGTNGPTVANSTVTWSYEHLTDALCYNEENGFYAGDKTNVETPYGWPAVDFKGMYYGENEDGVLESAYYNADTIPEFYNQGEIIIIKADREVVAMLMIEKPASYNDDKVLGIITGWQTVAGESTINGKTSYRVAVDVWTMGETKTFYTEDFASNKLPTTDISNDTNREGLAKDQLVRIQLLSDGKIRTKTSENGNGTILDVSYLMNGELTFAYTDYNRSNFYSINKISKLVNTIPAGWSEDANGKDVYNATATKGSVTVGETTSIRTCDETVFYTVNKVSDISNTASGIFQTVTIDDIKVGGSISVTDPDAGVYYVFAYTILTEETAVDSDNIGMMGTVYVFQSPVIVIK